MKQIVALFKMLRNLDDVAKQMGRCESFIRKVLYASGIKPKEWIPRKKGKDSPTWKGGRILSPQGYFKLHLPNHPRATAGGYVWEHVVIAEKKLGRSLKFFQHGDPRNENVHHINGIKTDNRPENLSVMTVQEHTKHEWEENEEKFPQSKFHRVMGTKHFKEWNRSNKVPRPHSQYCKGY